MQNEDFDEDFVQDGSPEESSECNEYSRDFLRDCIAKFFSDKTMHCGGSIPKYMVCSPNRIEMVLNTNLLDCVDRAYLAMRDMVSLEEEMSSRFTGEVTEDIRLVTDALGVLASCGVPQRFAGGIMLLYLRYVKGIKVDV